MLISVNRLGCGILCRRSNLAGLAFICYRLFFEGLRVLIVFWGIWVLVWIRGGKVSWMF
jgi:hypothetical protein